MKVHSTIVENNAALAKALPFHDSSALNEAMKGFIGAHVGPVTNKRDGSIVWDVDAYNFIEGEAPECVNPSLWRQCGLNKVHGLFEVVQGVYQVRGMDISNMTIVETLKDTIIVIDPLVSMECAEAALALYRKHRGGNKQVCSVIYSHSHIDHFGGVMGVVSEQDVKEGKVSIIAPIGFMEHAIAENVYAGPAMGRRAGYMYGKKDDGTD